MRRPRKREGASFAAGGFIFTGATQMAEPVDWMWRRIEHLDDAFRNVRDGKIWATAARCARCCALSIEVTYACRCPFCDLTAFLFTASPATREKWTMYGMVG